MSNFSFVLFYMSYTLHYHCVSCNALTLRSFPRHLLISFHFRHNVHYACSQLPLASRLSDKLLQTSPIPFYSYKVADTKKRFYFVVEVCLIFNFSINLSTNVYISNKLTITKKFIVCMSGHNRKLRLTT